MANRREADIEPIHRGPREFRAWARPWLPPTYYVVKPFGQTARVFATVAQAATTLAGLAPTPATVSALTGTRPRSLTDGELRELGQRVRANRLLRHQNSERRRTPARRKLSGRRPEAPKVRPAANPDASAFRSSRPHALGLAVICATLGLLVAACSGSAKGSANHRRSDARVGVRSSPASSARLSIAPAGGGIDTAPQQGITVTAGGARISKVLVRAGGDAVTGTLNPARTVWHSTWTLDVSRRYTVIASAVAPSGKTVTKTSSFRTLRPEATFSAEIVEGSHQTYGVGMPIILYLSRPVTDRAAVERALQVRTSTPVVGAWYWDSRCGVAPECLYFRPRRYWPAHTQVTFIGHLNGVEAAPGVYGHHTLTQTFEIGSPLIVVASTTTHYMKVYRDGRLFAHWPISTGRPGDDTPDGTYLTIEKSNPVDMVGPGYNIEVPWSVRLTFSGDYLHDAYWSVGEQGFTNVSHGCVNMPPADAEIYYKMAVPGDPVTITGSPRAGTWDNGWTMWFLPWKQWLRASGLHEAVQTGPDGSTFLGRGSLRASAPTAQLVPPRDRGRKFAKPGSLSGPRIRRS